MGNIVARLAAHAVIGLDTPVFIYHLEAHPDYLSLTQSIFSGIEAGQWQAVISTITLMEIAVQPWQMGREDIARKYEALLVHFPNLHIIPIDRVVARRAAKLRAQFHLRPPDVLQVAACLLHGAQAFVTNDRRLEKLGSLLDIVVLDDFIEG